MNMGETWERAFVTQNKWRLALNKREGVGKAYVAQGGILVLLGFYLMTCFNLVSQIKSNQNHINPIKIGLNLMKNLI